MAMEESAIRLIVGLGNPGKEYQDTRHNAGFWLLDQLASNHAGKFRYELKFLAEICKLQLGEQTVWLLKPQTFMNASGQAIARLCHFYKIPAKQVLVCHDELDFPAGIVRLKRGGGHGGHKGLKDTGAALGSNDFMRLRIGIGHPGDAAGVLDYVLGRPSQADYNNIKDVFDRSLEILPKIMHGDIQIAMQELHRP